MSQKGSDVNCPYFFFSIAENIFFLPQSRVNITMVKFHQLACALALFLFTKKSIHEYLIGDLESYFFIMNYKGRK